MKKILYQILPLLMVLLVGIWFVNPPGVFAQDNSVAAIAARSVVQGYITGIKAGYLTPSTLATLYLSDVATESSTAIFEQFQFDTFAITEENWQSEQIYQATVIFQPDGQTLYIEASKADNRWLITKLTITEKSSASESSVVIATPSSEEQRPLVIGKILIQPVSGGAFYLVSTDGTNLQYISNGIDPVLSPDGTKIAFTRWSSGNDGSVWIYDLTTNTENAVLGATQQAKSPAWLADGTQLIVSFQHGGWAEVLEKCTGLSQGIPRGAYDVDFNKDTICYKLPPDPHWQLRRITVATGIFEDLSSATYSMAPTTDPINSWRVIFANNSDGLLQLDLNRGEYFAFTSDSNDRGPVFSPDGSKVAVSYRQDTHWEIHTIDTTTGRRIQLTSTPVMVTIQQMLDGQERKLWSNAAPAWSPDGSQIAFVTNRTGKWEFWLMNADGSNPHPLLSDELAAQLNVQYNGMDERLISWSK